MMILEIYVAVGAGERAVGRGGGGDVGGGGGGDGGGEWGKDGMGGGGGDVGRRGSEDLGGGGGGGRDGQNIRRGIGNGGKFGGYIMHGGLLINPAFVVATNIIMRAARTHNLSSILFANDY
ncbi:hypothetical protein Pfo_001671 [Paulownia fortunei]|nr:hypothetical protein Pfo_001671 [Paulownia fortunei]